MIAEVIADISHNMFLVPFHCRNFALLTDTMRAIYYPYRRLDHAKNLDVYTLSHVNIFSRSASTLT